MIHLNKQNLEDGLDLVEPRAAPACRRSRCSTSRKARAICAPASRRCATSSRAARSRRFPGLLVTTPESRRRDLADFLGDSRAHPHRPKRRAHPRSRRAACRARRPSRRELGIADDELLCIAVGRMVPQKRPLLFLEVAAQIIQRAPEARFLWVGDGALAADWDAWVAGMQLGGIIRRLPWRSDVPQLLSAADVFIHVAEFEGLAFAILEALAAGLPCAITPNLLAEMPFLNAQNSLAIDSEGRWIDALRDGDRLRAIGQAARQLAEAQFSFARMAADYEALYRECAAMHQ